MIGPEAGGGRPGGKRGCGEAGLRGGGKAGGGGREAAAPLALRSQPSRAGSMPGLVRSEEHQRRHSRSAASSLKCSTSRVRRIRHAETLAACCTMLIRFRVRVRG